MNEARTLVVHCGGHKTGTSHVQYVLAESADALRAGGVVYPKSGRRGWAHHNLVWRLASAPAYDPAAGDVEAALAEAEASGAARAVLSAESLLVTGLAERLAAPFAAKGWRPVFLVYLRDQPDLLSSLYAQTAKRLRPVPRFADFVRAAVEDQASEAHYLRRLAPIEAAAAALGGELVVRPYAEGLDVLPDFLSVAAPGLDPAALAAPPRRVNATFGAKTVAAAARLATDPALRARLDRGPVRPGAMDAIFLEAEHRGWNATPFYGVTSGVSDRCAAAFGRQNAEIARRHFGRGWRAAMQGGARRKRAVFEPDKAAPAERAAFEEGVAAMRAVALSAL